jgi:ribosomal protein S11
MSLLLNNNNTSFEKEKIIKKEVEILLQTSKTTQLFVDNKLLLWNIIEKDKNSILTLFNKTFLKKHHFSNCIKKGNSIQPILYIINISILKKNTTIQVMNTKGQLKLFCSASSSLKLSGKQKVMQPKVLITLLKHFLNRALFLKNKNYNENKLIALHTKYLSRKFLKLVVRRLKKQVTIKTINYSNFFPHNGCRPKKLRRLKHKKKYVTTTKKLVTYTTKQTWKFLTQQRLHSDMS